MLSKKKIIAVVLFVLIGFAVFTFANPRNVEPATEPSTANEETKNVVDTTPEVNPTTPVVQPVIPVDNAPVITVEPALVKIVEGYDYDVLEGVTVTDDIDQNLTVTASVTESEDGYVVTYTVVDRSGNTATNTRTIVVLSPEGDEDGDHYTNEEEIENNSDFLDEDDTPEYDYRPTIDVSGITKTSMVYDTIKTLKAACEDEYYGTKGVTCTVDQSKVDFENVGTYEVLVKATDILGNEATTSFDYVVTSRPATVVIANKTTTYGKQVELTYTSKEELANYPIGVVLTKEEGTDVGKYAITGTYTNINYDVTFVNGTYTINKAKISISGSKKFLNVNAVYDGKEHTALLTGNLDKRLYVVYSNNTRTEAGTQEATATIKVKDEYKNNYYVSNGSAIKKATITVEKRDAKVIIDSKTTTYGNDVELTYTTENVVEGDDLNVVLTKEEGTDAGTYAITGTYDNDNYNVEFVNGTYTINKAKISISGSKKFLDVNAVYDGKEHTALLTGNLDSRLYVVYSNNTRVNAGTQEATATIKVKDEYKNNYYVSNGSAIKKATITVEKRDAKVIIDSKTTTYGNDVELTYTTENVVEGDDLNVVLTREVGTDVGTYTITGTYSNDNYNVEFVNGTYTINKEKISISASTKFPSVNATYDGQEHKAVLEGKLNNKLYVVYSNNTRTEAGTQEATATIKVKDEYKNNYYVSNGSAIKKATITVEKRDAKVIIDSKTTTYGNDVELTYTTENVVEGDDLNVVLTKEVGTDAGTYTITGTYSNDNYNVEFVNGTYTINKKLISIANVKFDDATFVYDTKEHEALVSGDLDDKLLVVYANNKKTEVGTQRAVASIVVKSEYANNYKVDATVQEYVKTANLTITKATPVLPELGNLEALEGDNLSSISLPEGYSFTEDKVLTLADDKEQNSETVNVKYCLADTTNYECVNTTATVVVKARLYTVTFMSDGSVYETQDVRVNKYATAPSVNPQKENYAFTGWDVDLANTPVTSAMTVNAQFTAGQLKIEISEKPNANFVFKQDPTNTSDKAIRDLIIVKKVYADGTKVETTSYKTNFDIKTTGEKVLLVTDDEGFTATHEYKVIVNVAFQTKFEVILNEKDATGKNSYSKTTDSSCTSNCDLSNKTHSVDLNANTLEVIEHYDENIVVTNIKATYANESNKDLNISSRQRWSRYTEGAWYDPMRLAYLTKQVKVGEERVCDFWLVVCLSSHMEPVYETVYDDVMESTNLIKYVDVSYDRTFRNGYEKSYVVRFEYNSADKKFTAISERQI